MEQPCRPPRAALCPWAVGVPVQRTDTLFSWDAGAVYYFTREFSTFVGASDSHLPIFNTEEPESIGSVPESGTQYEGGLRFSLGRRLAVSTAAYQVKRNSIFTVLLDPQTGLDIPATFSYRVRGWEADLNAEPIDRWSIVGNFSHQNPRISDYPQAPANLWTSYDLRLGGDLGLLRLKAGVRYHQRAYTDANNTRILPGSTLIDAGISWVLRRVELSVGVNNLADRTHWLYGAGTGGGAVPGPRRTVFGRVAARL
jgi:iron complex outermembrane receptor protein